MFSDTCSDQLVVFNYSQFNARSLATMFTTRTLVKLGQILTAFAVSLSGQKLNCKKAIRFFVRPNFFGYRRVGKLMKTCSTRSKRRDQYLCNNRETNDMTPVHCITPFCSDARLSSPNLYPPCTRPYVCPPSRPFVCTTRKPNYNCHDLLPHFLPSVGACNLILHIHVTAVKTGSPLISIT